MVSVLVMASAWAGGCAAPDATLGAHRIEPAPASERQMEAEWIDVPAAVDLALSAAEAAALDTQPARSGERYRYELTTIDGLNGWLELERDAFGPRESDEAAEIIMARCRIGSGGDRARQEHLLSALADRLAALRGKRVAPINNVFGLP